MAKEEENKEEKAAEASPEADAGKAKKKKLIIMIAGAVVLLGGVGGGLAFFLGGSKSVAAKDGAGEHGAAAPEGGEHGEAKEGGEHGEAKEGGEHGEAKEGGEHGEAKEGGGEHGAAAGGEHKAAEHKDDGVDFGCTYNFKPFHLNLGNPLENRYVRLEISVEHSCAEEMTAELEKRLPQLRDAVIAVASRKTREFLLGPDGKEQLRREIQNRLNQYMTRKIEDVYITDILIE